MMAEKKIYVLTENGQLRDRWLAVVAGSAAVSVKQLERLRDGIVIVDVDAPAFAHDQSLWTFAKSMKMIAATATPNDDTGILYLDRGAVGLIHAYSDTEVISQVLSVVAAGELWVGRTLLQRLLRGVARLPVSREEFKHASLTERENEVARLVAKGDSNKEIAYALTITERTVKAHVSTILDKLNVEDRLQLALKVNGIT